MLTTFLDHAPTIGLIFFFCVFVGIAVWVFLPANKQRLQQLGSLPLKDDAYER